MRQEPGSHSLMLYLGYNMYACGRVAALYVESVLFVLFIFLLWGVNNLKLNSDAVSGTYYLLCCQGEGGRVPLEHLVAAENAWIQRPRPDNKGQEAHSFNHITRIGA